MNELEKFIKWCEQRAECHFSEEMLSGLRPETIEGIARSQEQYRQSAQHARTFMERENAS